MDVEAPRELTFAWNPVSYATSFQPCSFHRQEWEIQSETEPWRWYELLKGLRWGPRWGSGGGSCRWRGQGATLHGAGSSPVQPCGAPQSLGPCCQRTACATQTQPAHKRISRSYVHTDTHHYLQVWVTCNSDFWLTETNGEYGWTVFGSELTRFSGSGGTTMCG